MIAASTTIRGRVSAEGDLAVFGRVEGSVTAAGLLEVGESAELRSDLHGRRVVVRGAVAGNVLADESIVLEAGARVVGDLTAPTIALRPGALVRGHVQTSATKADRAREEPARRAEHTEPRTAAASVRGVPSRPATADAPITVGRPAAPVATARPASAAAEPKRPPPPVVPKAAGRAGRRAEPEREAARAAPAPIVPVPGRRGARASRRSGGR